MVQTGLHWETLIEQVKKKHPDVKPLSFKFKHLVAESTEQYDLSPREIKQIALNLGFKLYPKPKGIPENWLVSFCKSHLGEKYTNPLDKIEWIVIKPPDSRIGGLPWVIHRTLEGFADIRWFQEVLPQLEAIITNPKLGRPFSAKFNENVNKMFADFSHGNGMTQGKVQALNLFFEKYVPGIDSICPVCFKVSLPISGAGERWVHQTKSGEKYEVRLSAAKPFGQAGQQVEYVSQTITDSKKTRKFASWDADNCLFRYSNRMDIKATHIPWTIYDYNKFNINMPICLCR